MWKAITIGSVIAIVAACASWASGATDMASVLFVIALIELLGVALAHMIGRLVRRTNRAS